MLYSIQFKSVHNIDGCSSMAGFDIIAFFKKRTKVAIFVLLIGIVISLKVQWQSRSNVLENKIQGGNHLKCCAGNFILNGMTSCHPWLRCAEIKQKVRITDRLLGSGAEKIVKEGFWHGYPVAINILKQDDFFHDFQHNLNMLKLFNNESGRPVNKIVQLVGWCFQQTSVIITELHPLGAANKIHQLLADSFPAFDTLKFKFGLCVEFVNILHILHSHSDGPRVMCDSNDPNKALSQFLLSENLSLVLSDMDALPLVNKSSGELIKCGHRELFGDYVAPEQLWPYDTKPFDDKEMPHYDEKVDIWKIPDICNFLIGVTMGASKLQLYLFDIHSKCKQQDPKMRPSARTVLDYYENVHSKLGWNLPASVLRDKDCS